MTETKRLGPWGWFVRAFAAGFGATFGVVVASALAVAGYALIAVALMAFSSLGGIKLDTASKPGKLIPQPAGVSGSAYHPTTVQPAPAAAYPRTVQPSPPIAGPYAKAGTPYVGYSSGYSSSSANPQPVYAAAAPETARIEEAADRASAPDWQPAPPTTTPPVEPDPAPDTDAPPRSLEQER